MKRRPTTTLLAGWLFADIFLGIAFVALASEPGMSPPLATPELEPAPAAEPIEQPPPGVEQHPLVVEVPSTAVSDDALRALFAAPVADGRRAAFALTFGVADQPGTGVQLARDLNARLRSTVPALFEGAAQRDFWQARNATHPSAGSVRVELYLFTPNSGDTP